MDIRPIANSAQPSPAQLDSVVPQAALKQAAAPLETTIAVTKPEATPSIEEVADAIKNINKTMQAIGQGIEFTVDSESQRTIIKVIDQETKEVLRQMPSEEALQIAKALDQVQGLLIKQHA